MKIDITNDVFNLHTINDIETYYPNYIQHYLESYIDFLNNNNIKDEVILKVKSYSRKIYICLIEYYCGQHDAARDFFRQAIKDIKLEKICNNLTESIFYRARKPIQKNSFFHFSNYLNKYSKQEMFHIPFEKRYLVTTQRYSYPGLPCLYLGSSCEVCCDELMDWSSHINIATIQKVSEDNIDILDLYFFERFDFNNISDADAEQFFLLWPLVACCSFVYSETKYLSFKPNYIIPQLLLEYIVDKNFDNKINETKQKLYGIRYHAVKKPMFTNTLTDQSNKYINYVFPALSDKMCGYCDILDNMFKVDNVFFYKELKHYENR